MKPRRIKISDADLAKGISYDRALKMIAEYEPVVHGKEQKAWLGNFKDGLSTAFVVAATGWVEMRVTPEEQGG